MLNHEFLLQTVIQKSYKINFLALKVMNLISVNTNVTFQGETSTHFFYREKLGFQLPGNSRENYLTQ